MNTKIFGLEKTKVDELSVSLNELLANFQIHYQNLRGLHWNIKGKSFFELHVKFEELYIDAQEKIDLIAERILTLEGAPLHTFQEYLTLASIPVGHAIFQDTIAVNLIVKSLKELIKIERGILEKSAAANDEGTNSLMSDFILEQEKTVWMMKAWLA